MIQKIREIHARGNPAVIFVRRISDVENLKEKLLAAGIQAATLHGLSLKDEAEVLSQAGEEGRVTIVTNVAGRGVNIKITDRVRELGGLNVILTKIHTSRRIDDQQEERVARREDPGESYMFLSLEDESFQRFGGPELSESDREQVRSEADFEELRLKIQENGEAFLRAMRGRALAFDDALAPHRRNFYQRRDHLLDLLEERTLPPRPEILKSVDDVWRNYLEALDRNKYRENISMDTYRKESDLLFQPVLAAFQEAGNSLSGRSEARSSSLTQILLGRAVQALDLDKKMRDRLVDFYRLYLRRFVHIEGLDENLKELSSAGPVIIAANHISWLDPLIAAEFFIQTRRWPLFVADQNPLASNFLGGILHQLDRQGAVITVSRDGGTRRKMEKHLQDKGVLGIFPGGHIAATTGEIFESWKNSVARISMETNTPIVPLAIWGDAPFRLGREEWKSFLRLFSVQGLLAPPFQLNGAFGKPIDPQGKSADQIMEELKQQISGTLDGKKIRGETFRSEARAFTLFESMGEPELILGESADFVELPIQITARKVRMGELWGSLLNYTKQSRDFLVQGSYLRGVYYPDGNRTQKNDVFEQNQELIVEWQSHLDAAISAYRSAEKIETGKHLITGMSQRLPGTPENRILVDLGSDYGELLGKLLPLFGLIHAVEKDRRKLPSVRALDLKVLTHPADYFKEMPQILPPGKKADMVLASHSLYTPHINERIYAISEAAKLSNRLVFVFNDVDESDPASRAYMRTHFGDAHALRDRTESIWNTANFLKALGFQTTVEHFKVDHSDPNPGRVYLLALAMLSYEERQDPMARKRLYEFVKKESPEGLKVPGQNLYRITNGQQIIWASREAEPSPAGITREITFQLAEEKQVTIQLTEG
ncbi:MAG TPA: 1-acyl-sn-glycerol-3-phosphate acyltransferase, partial [bacterium]|nr:1-acyl-sn-glycerol-3-phosphate acyltransferase [bacterium]